ncbi:MAG: cupin domain-containing protein [Tepidisphaeraceae bacterium]
MAQNAKVVRAAEQKNIWLLTDHLKPMLNGAETGGLLGVAISQQHPGEGTPPHVHRNEDEMFYVLDGEVTFLFGDKLIKATKGDFVYAPRNIVHCFKCTSATPSKMMLLVTPTAFMKFADSLAVPADDFANKPAVTPELIGKLMGLAPQFGIEMLLDHPLPTTLIDAPGPIKQQWVMGERVHSFATADTTNGAFTICEIHTAPAGGPPPHVHLEQDEIFFVVDGRHEFLLGDRTEIVSPGDVVVIPRGVRHRFSNLESTTGRLIDIHTPGGFERFFDECGTDATNVHTPPAFTPPPPEVIAAIFAKHGMTL